MSAHDLQLPSLTIVCSTTPFKELEIGLQTPVGSVAKVFVAEVTHIVPPRRIFVDTQRNTRVSWKPLVRFAAFSLLSTAWHLPSNVHPDEVIARKMWLHAIDLCEGRPLGYISGDFSDDGNNCRLQL